jgi:predicted nucleotidyltransferase
MVARFAERIGEGRWALAASSRLCMARRTRAVGSGVGAGASVGWAVSNPYTDRLLLPFRSPKVSSLEMAENQELVGNAKNPIDLLAEKLGSRWPHLAKARTFTQMYRLQLREELAGLDTEDTSVVVFGSLARDEATSKSDVDWTLLVDGMADPQHLSVAHEISRRLAKIQARPPGREGTFGNLAFSHEILHWIGGEDDSNANTTRRMLLLL